MSFHVGETVGDYEITGIIGAGSMGQVFKAEHRLTKRKEAIKVVAAELAGDQQIQRFQREIALQAALNHPNVAAVHNAMQIGDRFVLVMEFVEGQTLETLLQAAKLPLETGLDYVSQTLSALSYAHARGVIHRDVTPANLIVTPSGTVKLTDFGVAKAFGDVQITNCGEVVGSLQYMAPEQIRGDTTPDPRSDIYSVGAILYEILTGKKPFEESTLLLRLKEEQQDPKRPSEIDANLPFRWDGTVARAMAKDPAARYQTAKEFLAAIHGSAATSPAANVAARFKAMAVGGAIALVLLATAGLASSRFQLPPPPRAITFHILPPAPPASKPAVTARAHAVTKASVKKHVARRLRKKEAPLALTGPAAADPMPPPAAQPPAPQSPAVRSPAVQSQVEAPKAPEPKVAQPAPAVESTPLTPATPSPAQKKRFWTKLNPFRKKKSDSSLVPSEN